MLLENNPGGAVSRKIETFPKFPPLYEKLNDFLFKWIETVRITPVSAVQWQCGPEWIIQERTVRDIMCTYVLKGNGAGYIGDEKNSFTMKKGDLVIFPKGVKQSTWTAGGKVFEIINIHFFANICGSIDLVNLMNISGVYSSGTDILFQNCSSALAREYALKVSGSKEIMRSYIFQMIMHIIRFSAGKNSEKPCDMDKLLKLIPAFMLMEKQLNNPSLTVKEIAGEVSISEVYLRRLFQETVSMAPVEFIQQRRIDKACGLLSETGMSIQAISDVCGFSDKYFFHRVFKKLVTMTPSEYREQTRF
ncbi:MAG: hypothetical protein A2017_09415 [Lentisphaerae bacterium GWF2_44_16]|nr:MAG: hypothetical protein A2017_09415 [Lentisphaerae bacterium GWF2_44_16]